MTNFLDGIFAQLQRSAQRVVLQEIHGDEFVSVTGEQLSDRVSRARAYLRSTGLQAGDRCALLAPNSIQWAAFDLALMAEGLIVVPLYYRQAPVELAAMMKDCQARLLFVSEASLGHAVTPAWSGDVSEGPAIVTFDEALRANAGADVPRIPNPRADSDLVTIIYTSGTSGEPKGACLNVGNVNHMIGCTTERLDQLMGGATSQPDRIFHYLPCNFAGSWILLLSCLSRESVLIFSTDLNKLADEIRLAAPNYFLNVPTLLERVRRGVLDAISKKPAILRLLFAKTQSAWERQHVGRGKALDRLYLAVGSRLIFSQIKGRFGSNLRALICGSAPLAPETQQFFLMLGIPVLQVYGLTETTAICTMDDPRAPVEPGYVGPSISGIEMKIGENEEIVVRGPHIFPGYWNRPEETARSMKDGWFHTGDQGEVNIRGNWRIVGRIKNLVILNSGHNIPPEPIEDKLARILPGALQIVLVGNGKGYLCALITGPVEATAVQAALDTINSDLPHYRQIRNFTLLREAFTVENGVLTANGKLRRDIINSRFANEIAAMYASKPGAEAAKGNSA
jgi:long-chain acyl-CoA synthetase